MSLSTRHGLSVRRVRVHGQGMDEPTARRSAEQLLRDAPLQAVRGSSTILCIRHLAVRVTARQATPRQWASDASTRHMADALDALARAASRPALGPVPSHAQAVQFADRSEMLACLVHDWLAGTAPARWWWRDLLGSHSVAAAVRLACLASPDFVPALFERLARQDEVNRFVQALPPATAQDLLTTVLHAHQLEGLDTGGTGPATPAASTPSPPPPCSAPDVGAKAISARPPPRAAGSPGLAPPAWVTRCIPMSLLADLSAGQRALVVLSLALVRAPGELRGAATQAALGAWLRQAPQTAPAQISTTGTTGHAGTDARGRRARPLPAPLAPAKLAKLQSYDLPAHPPEAPTPRSSASSPPAPLADAQADTPHHMASPQTLPTQPLPPEQILAGVSGHRRLLPEAHHLAPCGLAHDLALSTSPAPIPPALLRPHPVDGPLTLHTQFGGLFYLVNAALALGLYTDFTRPSEPGIGLPVWDFLALAGLHLADAALVDLQADPAWPLLATLSGRPPEQAPGTHFVPPDDWQMPLSWLPPFADEHGAWRWQVHGKRLLVQHPAGFTVVDTRRDAVEAARQAQLAVRPYRTGKRFQLRSATPTTTPPSTPSTAPASDAPLARWCNGVMPYLALRLAQALRIQPATQAGAMLMRQPARLALSTARLDVYLQLAHLPLAVRMAGLDRNPGWVPAAGRTLAFHYE